MNQVSKKEKWLQKFKIFRPTNLRWPFDLKCSWRIHGYVGAIPELKTALDVVSSCLEDLAKLSENQDDSEQCLLKVQARFGADPFLGQKLWISEELTLLYQAITTAPKSNNTVEHWLEYIFLLTKPQPISVDLMLLDL